VLGFGIFDRLDVFGDMNFNDTGHSIALFARAVMPVFA
jgi:hypothetical protein